MRLLALCYYLGCYVIVIVKRLLQLYILWKCAAKLERLLWYVMIAGATNHAPCSIHLDLHLLLRALTRLILLDRIVLLYELEWRKLFRQLFHSVAEGLGDTRIESCSSWMLDLRDRRAAPVPFLSGRDLFCRRR